MTFPFIFKLINLRTIWPLLYVTGYDIIKWRLIQRQAKCVMIGLMGFEIILFFRVGSLWGGWGDEPAKTSPPTFPGTTRLVLCARNHYEKIIPPSHQNMFGGDTVAKEVTQWPKKWHSGQRSDTVAKEVTQWSKKWHSGQGSDTVAKEVTQ